MKTMMEITLETICQQQQELKVKFKEELDKRDQALDRRFEKLESKVDSVKTWFVTLAFTTLFAVIGVLTLIW